MNVTLVKYLLQLGLPTFPAMGDFDFNSSSPTFQSSAKCLSPTLKITEID